MPIESGYHGHFVKKRFPRRGLLDSTLPLHPDELIVTLRGESYLVAWRAVDEHSAELHTS